MPKKCATPTIDRLMAKVAETGSGCWEFQGSKHSFGYGQIRDVWGGRLLSAHRVTYEFFRCEIPEGLFLDHLCRNPPCCNPWHLEPVTNGENVRRGVGPLTAGQWRAEYETSKTHCPYGHAYDERNTYFTGKGHRQCRKCKGRRQSEYMARKASQVPSIEAQIEDALEAPAKTEGAAA
jgi:hypothetical protein